MDEGQGSYGWGSAKDGKEVALSLSGKGEITPFFSLLDILGRSPGDTTLEATGLYHCVGILYTNDATLVFRCEFVHCFMEISLLILRLLAKAVFHVAGLVVGALQTIRATIFMVDLAISIGTMSKDGLGCVLLASKHLKTKQNPCDYPSSEGRQNNNVSLRPHAICEYSLRDLLVNRVHISFLGEFDYHAGLGNKGLGLGKENSISIMQMQMQMQRQVQRHT